MSTPKLFGNPAGYISTSVKYYFRPVPVPGPQVNVAKFVFRHKGKRRKGKPNYPAKSSAVLTFVRRRRKQKQAQDLKQFIAELSQRHRRREFVWKLERKLARLEGVGSQRELDLLAARIQEYRSRIAPAPRVPTIDELIDRSPNVVRLKPRR